MEQLIFVRVFRGASSTSLRLAGVTRHRGNLVNRSKHNIKLNRFIIEPFFPLNLHYNQHIAWSHSSKPYLMKSTRLSYFSLRKNDSQIWPRCEYWLSPLVKPVLYHALNSFCRDFGYVSNILYTLLDPCHIKIPSNVKIWHWYTNSKGKYCLVTTTFPQSEIVDKRRHFLCLFKYKFNFGVRNIVFLQFVNLRIWRHTTQKKYKILAEKAC